MSKYFKHFPKTTADVHSLFLTWNTYEKDKNHLRFGQWVYNTYITVQIPWPELYYEEDTMKAYSIILEEVNHV